MTAATNPALVAMHPEEPRMVRTAFTTITAAGLMTIAFAPATVSASTLNIQVRPNIQVNTTLHVEVKPRLYHDVILTDSCVNHQKRSGHGIVTRKRCQWD
jgi:hypothetical protein